jgi:hypothetical protein
VPASCDVDDGSLGGFGPHRLLQLQRLAGNQAVCGLMAAGGPTGSAARADGRSSVQRKQDDAQAFSNDKGLGITVTHARVSSYVSDTNNDRDLRLGLLQAWNKGRASGDRWTITAPADLAAPSNPYHYSTFPEYQNWTKTTTGVTIPIFGGIVSATHSRGAPKIGSDKTKWGNTTLGDSYKEYVRGLRSGGVSDATIAKALLTLDDTALTSDLEKRAAAMITITVTLAEEWRKQGAAKIYRAILRRIEEGTKTFDDLLQDFDFITSAQDGRQQVGRFYDAWLKSDMGELLPADADYYDVLSPVNAMDYSSDEDMRTDEKKNLKTKRLFADKYG